MKKALTLILALAMLFSLAACGETPLPAAESEKTVKTALISSVSKPLSWVDSDGVLQGYEYDVLCLINDMLEDYTLEFEPCTEEVQDMTVESGDFDLSAGGYMWNEDREAAYALPENPIGATAFLLYVRPEDADNITCMQDVIDGGYKLCPVAPNGGIYKSIVEWNEANGSPMSEIPSQADLSAADKIEMLASGQYDVYIETVNIGVVDVAKEMGIEVVQVEEPLSASKTVVLIKKDDTEFCEAIDAALKKLKEDGTLSELSNKWYGYDIFTLID